MNECEQASRLNAYHDGEMSPAGVAAMEQHLRQCPRCAAELERFRKLTGMIGSLPPPALPTSSLRRLHQAVDLQLAARLRRMAEVLAAVAAVVLVVCLIGLTRRTPAQGSPGAMPVWEIEALAQPLEPAAGSEEALASWMVRDLSLRDEHD